MNLTTSDLDSRISKAYLDGNEPVRLALIELRDFATRHVPEADFGNICHWNQDQDENWEACDSNMFVLTEGTPKENGFKFCPYCGKPITEAKYSEPEEPKSLIKGRVFLDEASRPYMIARGWLHYWNHGTWVTLREVIPNDEKGMRELSEPECEMYGIEKDKSK